MANPPDQPKPLPETVVAALRKGQKIEAIKILRQEWGIGLKEAKDSVDRYVQSDPLLQRSMQMAQAESRRGCLLWLVVGIALAAAVYYFLGSKG
ncbi:MAG: ribosomal protein L7/L12 [Nitrospiraceae bacterium]